MKVKFVILSLAALLSPVTFAWGFFGPSAKDVENAFIERWKPTSRHIFSRVIEDKLEMKSVKATKTERKDIWKVTYTLVEPYAARKDTTQGENKGVASNVTGLQKGGNGSPANKTNATSSQIAGQNNRDSVVVRNGRFELADSILDQLGMDESKFEVKYKRVSYVSVYSVHKQDGKLVLKSLPVPADLN